ncbi:MAG TPA: TetR/AcrR family transcriptional regulator [Trebonia sp.]
MGRQAVGKDELLQRVIECLAEQGIAQATFRSLAASLGISTYPLVHHFGSKEQLLGAVVAEVERRQREYADRGIREGGSLVYWQWCTENPDLLRLDLEILLQEGRGAAGGRLADLVFREWHERWIKRLTDAGLPPDEAETEATLMVALGVGLQIDLVATGDTERVTRAFRAQRDRRRPSPGPGPSQ